MIAIGGFFFINPEHFKAFNLSGESTFSAVTATAALTLWAFLGLESATIPAENIDRPEKTIPNATMLGTLITTVVYITSTLAVMGLIPPEELAISAAPFADAAAIMWGRSAYYWVGAAAVIATFGALNGWILMQGQMPMAVARDKLFPKIFGKKNSNGAPAAGLVISSILVSVLMTMNFTRGLVETFKFAILLSTITVLVAYLFSAASYMLRVLQKKYIAANLWVNNLMLAFCAFAYSLWALAGSGQETVYWGLILLMAGIPIYVLVKPKNQSN